MQVGLQDRELEYPPVAGVEGDLGDAEAVGMSAAERCNDEVKLDV